MLTLPMLRLVRVVDFCLPLGSHHHHQHNNHTEEIGIMEVSSGEVHRVGQVGRVRDSTEGMASSSSSNSNHTEPTETVIYTLEIYKVDPKSRSKGVRFTR